MKITKYLGLTIVGLIVASILIGIGLFISTSNKEVGLRNRFTQKFSERSTTFDAMFKIINQKGQVAVKNDSSFRRNVELIMIGRADSEGVMMKWITESNPNANFQEVSALYKDLSRAIESERKLFLQREIDLQDIKREHDDLLGKFPSSMVLSFLGRQPLEYRAITSDRTEDAVRTGKDNDISVF